MGECMRPWRGSEQRPSAYACYMESRKKLRTNSHCMWPFHPALDQTTASSAQVHGRLMCVGGIPVFGCCIYAGDARCAALTVDCLPYRTRHLCGSPSESEATLRHNSCGRGRLVPATLQRVLALTKRSICKTRAWLCGGAPRPMAAGARMGLAGAGAACLLVAQQALQLRSPFHPPCVVCMPPQGCTGRRSALCSSACWTPSSCRRSTRTLSFAISALSTRSSSLRNRKTGPATDTSMSFPTTTMESGFQGQAQVTSTPAASHATRAVCSAIT